MFSRGIIVNSRKNPFSYDIQYTKSADKFFNDHEDIRDLYEAAIKELLVGDHPEQVDVKRIKGKKNDYYRIRLGGYRVVYAMINEHAPIQQVFIGILADYSYLRGVNGYEKHARGKSRGLL